MDEKGSSTSRSVALGERVELTVLFAHIDDPIPLIVERDPEETRQLLDALFERMMEAVHQRDGIVNQMMVDGIVALFGAPIAYEDHAVRACQAGLNMQETIGHYAEHIKKTYGISIRIRVGLNSGQVFVRAIGSNLSMEYTAVGRTTYLAAQMGQLASPGRILITAATAARVEGYIGVIPLGQVAVKGLSDQVEVYELTGAVSGDRRAATS